MLETAFTLPFWFEFAATVTGGLSGGMSAARARYDIFGCVAIACITGMGGGIIRDVLLQEYGLYAFQSPWFLLSCAVAGVIVFYFGKLATYLDPIVDLLDNISVALWAIIGASKSLSAGLGIIPSVVLGTITALGGGISRDVLMNRAPVAFQTGPIYGSAALIGCIVYCPLKANGILPDSAGFLCAMLIMALRYLSLILGWRTKPPRDYSDRVVESVVRPARFIARKVHVPMGKTARGQHAPGTLQAPGQAPLRPLERPMDGRDRRADAAHGAHGQAGASHRGCREGIARRRERRGAGGRARARSVRPPLRRSR